MRLGLVIVAPFLLTALTCVAQPDEEVIQAMTRGTGLTAEQVRRDYNVCAGATMSMKICGFYNFTKQDLRMNRIYKEALANAKELGYQDSLVHAQRAWLAYRDAACKFEGEFGAGGGSAEGLYVLSCKEELTAERADRLSRLNSKEGR